MDHVHALKNGVSLSLFILGSNVLSAT